MGYDWNLPAREAFAKCMSEHGTFQGQNRVWRDTENYILFKYLLHAALGIQDKTAMKTQAQFP